jgi:TonB-dependent SusC/RagA subfamily outer membrane receptor
MKNTHFKLVLSLVLSFALLFPAHGQKKANMERADRLIETSDILTLKGTVTAFNKYCVNNAEVTSRKTRSKAFTDSLGRFEIMASSEDVLIITANGFEKNRIQVSANDDKISANMILAPGEKNENLAIAYGHIDERELAEAVGLFRNNKKDIQMYSNLRGLIQAELPEATVTDRGNIQVFIRGRDTSPFGLSENNGACMFVVDNMIISSIDFLDPCNVTSVRLLKGAEATGLYGSRGVNGVVLIKTN